MQGSNGNIYVCKVNKASGGFSQSDWQIASKYTDDSSLVSLATGLADGTVAVDLSSATIDGTTSISVFVANEVDSAVVVFSGTSTEKSNLSGMKTNDIYIEKTVDTTAAVDIDVVNTYKYSGTVWVAIGSNSNLTALADMADGKRTIYSNTSDSVPSGEANDVWIPTTGSDDETYIPGEVYQYSTLWKMATKYSENLEDFVVYRLLYYSEEF
jgi:hypothetical protein